MLLALTAAFAMSQAFRTVAAILAAPLQAEFHLTPQQLGTFAASFHFAFGAMQLLVGIGIDLHGVRRTVLTGFPLAIAGALFRVVRLDRRTRTGLALFVGWAICSGLLAFFADDLEGQPQRGSGVIHLMAAFLAFTCVTIGTILISAGLLSYPAWRPAAPVLLAISVAGAIG